MAQPDRDYLGVEELIEETLVTQKSDDDAAVQRGEAVRFTMETPGWKEFIEPYLWKLTAMPAVDPSQENWERKYITNYALLTVASKILGILNNWVDQASDLNKERQDEERTTQPTGK